MDFLYFKYFLLNRSHLMYFWSLILDFCCPLLEVLKLNNQILFSFVFKSDALCSWNSSFSCSTTSPKYINTWKCWNDWVTCFWSRFCPFEHFNSFSLIENDWWVYFLLLHVSECLLRTSCFNLIVCVCCAFTVVLLPVCHLMTFACATVFPSCVHLPDYPVCVCIIELSSFSCNVC